MRITKRLEFDYGHRVPSHGSKCRNVHGHRGVLEVTLTGPIKPITGGSDDGMVLDFADIKALANELVVEPWDHAFIVYEGDQQLVAFLDNLPNHKTVKMPFIPTAEHLARAAFEILHQAYVQRFGDELVLWRVRFYETPNSWADAYA